MGLALGGSPLDSHDDVNYENTIASKMKIRFINSILPLASPIFAGNKFHTCLNPKWRKKHSRIENTLAETNGEIINLAHFQGCLTSQFQGVKQIYRKKIQEKKHVYFPLYWLFE